MLKKCLKHEWKACWKNMALLNGGCRHFHGRSRRLRIPLFPNF